MDAADRPHSAANLFNRRAPLHGASAPRWRAGSGEPQGRAGSRWASRLEGNPGSSSARAVSAPRGRVPGPRAPPSAGSAGGRGDGGGAAGPGVRGSLCCRRVGSARASVAAAGGMASTASEIIAFMVSISGWVLVSSTLPTDYWKVSTIDGTVITTATYWANLWKTCVTDSTGVSNCKDFPSMLALDGLHPPSPPAPDPRSLLPSARGWAPAEPHDPRRDPPTPAPRRPPRTPSHARPRFPSRSLEEPGKSPRCPWPAFPGHLSRGGACLSPDPRGG